MFGMVIVFAGVLLFYSREASEESVRVQTQEAAMSEFTITSSAFSHNGKIPASYTCDGDDTRPPLEISGVPEGTQSLTLIVHDPDAPVRGGWTHWVVFNIPPTVSVIEEGTEPSGVPGKNSWGRTGYGGPCPPGGVHRYFFKLSALDSLLALPEGSDKSEVERATGGHLRAEAELMGLYERKR